MFSLLGGLWQYLFQKKEYYVLILGLDNAGKTTLLEKFKAVNNAAYHGMPLEKITPTVGLNVGRSESGRTRLTFWDLGGQRELQSMWDKYYSEAHALVYVVDGSDPERLSESHHALNEVISHESLRGVPLLILVNKSDLPAALDVAQVKAVFNASAPKIGPRDCKVRRVSAFSGENLHDSVDWLIASVCRNSERRSPADQN